MAGSLAEAESLIQATNPDGLILDMHLPDGDGLGLLRKLQQSGQAPLALILSICDEVVYAPRMFAAGARGFVMKDQPLEIILEALQNVLQGKLAFSAGVVTRLLEGHKAPPRNPLERLSAQELAVCRLLASGLRNKEVAARMGLSPQTVGTYKSRILRKLNLTSQLSLEEFMRLNSQSNFPTPAQGSGP